MSTDAHSEAKEGRRALLEKMDAICLRFEAAWQAESPPSIGDFLAEGTMARPPIPVQQLLSELIVIDMEQRWKRSSRSPAGAAQPDSPVVAAVDHRLPSRPLLEDYAACFPALGPLEYLPVEMIAAEYQIRQDCGYGPSHDEYLQRFPHQAGSLPGALRRAQKQLAIHEGGEPAIETDTAVEMSEALTAETLVSRVVHSGVMSSEELRIWQDGRWPSGTVVDGQALAAELVHAGKLTPFQAKSLCRGPAQLVFGKYVLLDRLGEGGMAQVFKARHRHMDRLVAVKFLGPHLAKNEEASARFRREVKAVARLSHPNIVAAYDADEAHGQPFLVMEYVDGRDLYSVLKDRGRLPVDEAVGYVLHVARGLEYAHRQGVVHRDIKPPNLLVDTHGTVKILDLGLASATSTSAEADAGRLTRSGQALGTWDYMAPEQAAASGDADRRSDIYSLGCTLYHLLTGELPYGGIAEVDVLLAHRGEAVPTLRHVLPDVPDTLDAICQKMMAKRPEDRYQDMTEVLQDLEVFLGQREGTLSVGDRTAIPKQISRYQVLGPLGSSMLGRVYRACDPEARRTVAIKILPPQRVPSEDQERTLRAEIQILSGVNHPGVVQLLDFGSTEDGRWFLVTEFVDGPDLAQCLRSCRLSPQRAAEIAVGVAEALQRAHEHGLIHRNLKPSNILLASRNAGAAAPPREVPKLESTSTAVEPYGEVGLPRLVDFGLGLRDDELGSVFGRTRPPGYLSPEQARGEGHRIDARSDIFALGVILYEMLTGLHPFQGRSREETLTQIKQLEPPSPRQIDPRVPAELARICQKAISKLVTDRYQAAGELAEELQSWQRSTSPAPSADNSPAGESRVQPGCSEAPSIVVSRVIPKGLRSFDAEDADFFLSLLPGPRDRTGLPESIRFWKTRIEDVAADQPLPVGVIYGPSGCGKSSLVKAGLLPRLPPHVTGVYVEASAADTEARTLLMLRRRLPDLKPTAGLAESLASLRRGRATAKVGKVLLVLDQFEQWLQARPATRSDELVEALRQCDGLRVQAILLVRDDFWLATSRLFRELDVPLHDGESSLGVDLFNPHHARQIMAAFGVACGSLPEAPPDRTPDQEAFLDLAVKELSGSGKIVAVHLAVFFEMVKGRPWCPATLRDLGGTEGIGVSFLEEMFCSHAAPLECRAHEQAVRRVLALLLPEPGNELKGCRRGHSELLAASGYGERPTDFEQLLQVLDGRLRLITPLDAEPIRATVGGHPTHHREEEYQLTHDFLVPSVRTWLTRRQRETARGRAELCLRERAKSWQARRERRQLPSLSEWFRVLCLTRRVLWSRTEQEMMASTNRYYLTWLLVLMGLVAVVAGPVWWEVRRREREHVRELVAAVISARADALEDRIGRLAEYARDAVPMLEGTLAPDAGPREGLHRDCALAALGCPVTDRLVPSIVTAPPDECKNVVSALARTRPTSIAQLSAQLTAAKAGPNSARYALTLLYLGEPEAVRAQVRAAPDSTGRTEIVHLLKDWRCGLDVVVRSLDAVPDGDFRSALCAALGLIFPETLIQDERVRAERVLLKLFRDAPEPGVHSAAGWTLRQWKVPDIEQEIAATRTTPPGRDWFINRHQITMLRIPAGTFRMGNPEFPDLANQLHDVTVSHPFFISDSELTNVVCRQFMEDPAFPSSDRRTTWELSDRSRRKCPTADSPCNDLTWYEKLLFCNWLSLREGRRPCYRKTAEREQLPRHDPTKMDERSMPVWECDFSTDGYRLPTEAEWEYACRAGTVTRFSFGDHTDRLLDYAVYGQETAAPVRGRLPNAWGLFDMHGNLNECCWDRFADYPKEPVGDPTGGTTGVARIHRGGVFHLDPEMSPSGFRSKNDQLDLPGYGFRVVCRDMPPASG